MSHRDLLVLDGLRNSRQLRQHRRPEFAYRHPFNIIYTDSKLTSSRKSL
jgi:hypothetical protein